jgi:hypothetical protein
MGAERRRWPRQTYAGGWLPPSARVRPGAPVIVVNLSRGGALVESSLRLRWGTRCAFEWMSAQGVVSVPARVARCFVGRLEPAVVRYRTALTFEALVAPPAEQDLLAEYQLPAKGPAHSGGGVVTAPRSARPRHAGAGCPTSAAREKDSRWHRP